MKIMIHICFVLYSSSCLAQAIFLNPFRLSSQKGNWACHTGSYSGEKFCDIVYSNPLDPSRNEVVFRILERFSPLFQAQLLMAQEQKRYFGIVDLGEGFFSFSKRIKDNFILGKYLKVYPSGKNLSKSKEDHKFFVVFAPGDILIQSRKKKLITGYYLVFQTGRSYRFPSYLKNTLKALLDDSQDKGHSIKINLSALVNWNRPAIRSWSKRCSDFFEVLPSSSAVEDSSDLNRRERVRQSEQETDRPPGYADITGSV